MLGDNTIWKLVEGGVKFLNRGSDGMGGSTLLEQVQILIDTVAGGYSIPAFARTEELSNGTSKRVFRMRVVAATRCKLFILTIESVP